MTKLKVTVCEMHDEPAAFAADWERLVEHVASEASELVVLPEMPFYPWFAVAREFDPATWQAAVAAHDRWLDRLSDLAPATVIGSRPVSAGGRRFNEGFVWTPRRGYRAAHVKYYLPDEDGFWEASWYSRGASDFSPVQSDVARIGMLICTEIWFSEHARSYGKAGVHLIATPRVTERATLEKWLIGGRVAAVVSGAYSLSSNRVSQAGQAVDLGGQGWIVGPDGEVLGLTSRERPFMTLALDLEAAERAKRTYPRYVPE
jgi:N-carbamoylputrescine amidase